MTLRSGFPILIKSSEIIVVREQGDEMCTNTGTGIYSELKNGTIMPLAWRGRAGHVLPLPLRPGTLPP